MKKIENECVGCPPEMGCDKLTCRYWNSVRFFCDKCGEEKKLYHFEGEELCIDCIAENLEVVEGSEF